MCEVAGEAPLRPQGPHVLPRAPVWRSPGGFGGGSPLLGHMPTPPSPLPALLS